MEQERVLALYDAYADSVYRVALGYLRSAHDAEDAVQAHGDGGRRQLQQPGDLGKRVSLQTV